MVNPGAFRGSRFQFMKSQKAKWERAVQEGMTNETLLTIQRRYFKRYPIDLPHDVEPSDEHLAAVDDDAPDVDTDPQQLLSMMVVPITGHKPVKRSKLVKFRKTQIHRWLQYQYAKDHALSNKNMGPSNPYTVLISQLTGKDPEPPRKKSAANLWRKTESARKAIEKGFQLELSQAQAKNKPIPKSAHLSRRDAIARTLFAKLTKTERDHWEETALKEKKEAKSAHQAHLEGPVSTNPEDRQRAIQTLPQVVMPILDFIADVTGWKATLIVGGPEPAKGGQLNVLSIHSGTTNGDIPLNFGQSEHERYEEQIIPIFGSFLKKCFTPAECRLRALPRGSDMIPLSMLEPGPEQDPHAVGVENPRTFLHPVETGLEVNATPPPPSHPVQSIATANPSADDQDSPSPDDDDHDHPFPFSLRDEEDWPASEHSDSAPPSPTPSYCGTPILRASQDIADGAELRRRLPPPGLIITTDDNFSFPQTASAEEQDCPVMFLPTVQFVTAGGYTSLHMNPDGLQNRSPATLPVIDPVLQGQAGTISAPNAIIRSAIAAIPLSGLPPNRSPAPPVNPVPASQVPHPIRPIRPVDFILIEDRPAVPDSDGTGAGAASSASSTPRASATPANASTTPLTTANEFSDGTGAGAASSASSAPPASVTPANASNTPPTTANKFTPDTPAPSTLPVSKKRGSREETDGHEVAESSKRVRRKSEKALALEVDDKKKKTAAKDKWAKKDKGKGHAGPIDTQARLVPPGGATEGPKRGRGRPKKVVQSANVVAPE